MSQITQGEKIAIVVTLVVIAGFFFVFANPFNRGASVDPLSALTEGVYEDDNVVVMNEDEKAMGVDVNVLAEGEGEVAKVGDVLTVNYVGSFEDGTVFDTSLAEGREPFEFTLGAGQVIQGWDQGVVGMKVGEKRLLTIPPELGYGFQDFGPIPGGSVLIFEVELLGIN